VEYKYKVWAGSEGGGRSPGPIDPGGRERCTGTMRIIIACMHGPTRSADAPRVVRIVVAHRAKSVGQLGRASPPPVDIDRMLAKGAAGLAVVLIALAVATEHLARVKVEW